MFRVTLTMDDELVLRIGWGDMDWCGRVMGCHAMPMFHGMGVFQLATAVGLHPDNLSVMSLTDYLQPSCGVVLAVFRPSHPAVFPIPQNVMEAMIATKCTLGAATATFYEVCV